jgi:hypothetical protein
MTKTFEDSFSEFQADMVLICLEYASNRVDEIYIYCSSEGKVISSNFFFRINGMLVRKDKLNVAINFGSDGFTYNTSADRQRVALKIINENILKIIELCKEFNRKMPTEMKLIYNVKRNSMVADYKYDFVYSNDPEKTADDVENEWFIDKMSESAI